MKSNCLTATLFALALIASLAATARAEGNLAPGKYRIDVETANGDNAAELVVKSSEGGIVLGTLQFWKGPQACKSQVNLQGSIDNEKLVLKAPGTVMGCDRALILEGSFLTGVLDGPVGVLKIKLTKL